MINKSSAIIKIIINHHGSSPIATKSSQTISNHRKTSKISQIISNHQNIINPSTSSTCDHTSLNLRCRWNQRRLRSHFHDTVQNHRKMIKRSSKSPNIIKIITNHQHATTCRLVFGVGNTRAAYELTFRDTVQNHRK